MNKIEIRTFRKEYGLSPQQLAELTKSKISTVQSWEHGKRNISKIKEDLIENYKKECFRLRYLGFVYYIHRENYDSCERANTNQTKVNFLKSPSIIIPIPYEICAEMISLEYGLINREKRKKEKAQSEIPPEGEGEILKVPESEQTEGKSEIARQYSISYFRQNGYAPFYSESKVSAGRYDLATIAENEEADSWLKLPGVSAKAWFPVIGFRFEPKIYAGDIIGVRQLERWDRVDPDKIYMIVTHEDRMIKRLRIDSEDPETLWCFSENYREFKINSNDIKAIYHVVFAGRLV